MAFGFDSIIIISFRYVLIWGWQDPMFPTYSLVQGTFLLFF